MPQNLVKERQQISLLALGNRNAAQFLIFRIQNPSSNQMKTENINE
jgi:hypothetical protein